MIAISWWSAETRNMEYHRYSGYAVMWLILVRIYWGVWGSETSRFRNFVRHPRDIAAYMGRWREISAPWPGHNPLGGLSVVGLIAVMTAQVLLGLFSVDVDGLESGPLASYVSFDLGRLAAKAHKLSFNVLLAFICLHLVAVAFYVLYKRHELIRPMLSGRRRGEGQGRALHFAPLWRVLPGAALAALLVWLVATGFQP